MVRTHPIGSMPKAGTNCSQLKSLNIFSSIGKVGIELGMNWYEAQNPDEPRINTTLDLAFQFTVTMITSPLLESGSFPDDVVSRAGVKLPIFKADEISSIQGSIPTCIKYHITFLLGSCLSFSWYSDKVVHTLFKVKTVIRDSCMCVLH